MTKNPFLNALCASGYILLIGAIMTFISNTLRDKPDTFFAPVIAMSLLTLSVTVMAYLFFYQPLQFFIDGKKREAVKLFVQTVGIFGTITVFGLLILLSGLV